MIDDATLKKAAELRRSGLTMKKVSEQLGYSVQYLYANLKDSGYNYYNKHAYGNGRPRTIDVESNADYLKGYRNGAQKEKYKILKIIRNEKFKTKSELITLIEEIDHYGKRSKQ